MLTDEALPPLPPSEGEIYFNGRRVNKAKFTANQMRDYGRAIEQAAYAAAIKAIEATKIDEDDLVEEIDREVNRTIDNCIDTIRKLAQEQSK